MKLSDIGEEALIERIVAEHFLPVSGPGLVVGVGDDTAALELGSGNFTLVTTDLLIEGTHFRFDIITPYQLGWKSVAVNISDIAAMGGVPNWGFVSIALKPDTDVALVDQIYHGMTDCSSRFGSAIIGGDTNSVAGNPVINVCQMGWVEPGNLTRRTGAAPGDRVLVTGWLGNSRTGLELLLKHGLDQAAHMCSWLVETHLMPIPRVPEARAAVETGGVRAMMDISDGLGSDLPKLCKASGVGAVVYADRLPISDDLRDAADILGMSAVDLAAGGGEDFELLMAAPPDDVPAIVEAVESVAGTKVYDIGEFTEAGVEMVCPDGVRRPLTRGWEHFA